MVEHLNQDRIAKYKSGDLPLTDLLSVKQHLQQCFDCQTLVDKAALVESIHSRLFSTLLQTPDKEHLSYEQLDGFIDGNLDANERGIVETHLESCPDCRFDVVSMQESLLSPKTAPALSWGHHLKGFLASWRFLFPLQAVLASAVILLLIYSSALKGRINNLNAQLENVAQTNQALQDQLASLSPTPASDPRPQAVTPTDNLVAQLVDNGQEIALDAQGKLSGFQGLTESQERLIKDALGSGRVKSHAFVSDHDQGLEVRGGGNSENLPQPLSPVGVVVQATRPTFQWKPVASAAWFKVTIYNSSASVVTESPEIKESRWTPAMDLRRGETYSWEITSQINAKEVLTPPRKFKILATDCLSELQRAKGRAESSHLLLGLLYADCGLIDDAEKELSALVRANPQSPQARNLLSSVRRLRSR